jgi:hypothetical protein
LARQFFKLQLELDSIRNATNDAVLQAALQLRKDMKDQDVPQTWPPDVENDSSSIPSSLQWFLIVLLQGEYSNSPPERIDRLTNSFGSDLVYAVSRGKIKPKKHILLPFTVKSLTGNVEMIQTLNRLGHGVSYSQVEEIDTALCLQKMATCETTSHYQEIFF